MRRMCLGAVINWAGGHMASWRHPHVPPGASMSFDFYRRVAESAERGKLDLLFLADHLSVGEANAKPEDLEKSGEVAYFDPLILLSGLASVTRHIGLTATLSTTYNEPYNVARTFASLDHLSGGRSGWNVVTSTRHAAALNYGRETQMEHDARYDRAREFVDVVMALWDSWDDDAFLYDKDGGRYFDRRGIHFQNHKGPHFTVRGPLNVARPPQGHPVVIQAGASDPGQELAAETADVVFTGQLTFEGAQKFYRGLKARMAKFGRPPEAIRVMPGLVPITGRTSAEAREKYEAIQRLIDPEAALHFLSLMLGGASLAGIPLDQPQPQLPPGHGGGSSHPLLQDKVRRENLTLRQLAFEVSGARRHRLVVGSGLEIADSLQHWFENEAADGFNVFPAWMPEGIDDFVEHVVPILQDRGLFRTLYEGRTLRENLGLTRPKNRYSGR